MHYVAKLLWVSMILISSVDKKTNEEILNLVQENRKIVNTIWCCKHKRMARVLWHE